MVVRLWNNEQTITPILDIGVGANGTQIRLQPNRVSINSADLWVNTINSNGVNDVEFQRNSVEFMKFEGTNDRTAFSKDIYMNSSNGIFTSNITNSLSNDLSLYATLTNTMRFYANAVEKMNITSSQINVKQNMSFQTGGGVSVYTDDIFVNNISARVNTADVAFLHNTNTYMFYDYDVSTFKFLVDVEINGTLDTTGLINGSDRKIKTEIEDVKHNCSDIVKNIKLKSYKYKEPEKHGNDTKKHIGFIANEVAEVIPQDFQGIVNTDKDYLRLNYIEMNTILWKALQEQMVVIDKMNKKITKLEKEVKDLKK